MPFDGDTYDRGRDGRRLGSAIKKVFQLMKDGKWRTLAEVAEFANCSEAGASARIRDLRKEKFQKIFGELQVNSRRRSGGTWEYQIRVPEASTGRIRGFLE